ncbi:unnamed protein product [Rhizoctonia solani]|uniref:DRBM domain-containing protein n=1 Tax=Rhizoctonia solani TaxID=456999 RepID=A0A8H2ZUV8_9AGAM|nr:unnamed protein product [Rhizoctonia solani]
MPSNNIWTLRIDPAKNNWLEKLNEWAQIFKSSVDWEVISSTNEDKQIVHSAIPTIRGIRMSDCTGYGSSKKAAKNDAAKKLSDQERLVRYD